MAVTVTGDIAQISQVAEAALGVTRAIPSILSVKNPEVAVRIDGQLTGPVSGNSISFPYWSETLPSAQACTRDSRTGVTPDKISLAADTVTATARVVSIDFDSYALSDASADAWAHLAYVTGRSLALALQSDLITAAETTTLSLDWSAEGNLTVDAILQARCEWGEYASEYSQCALFVTTPVFKGLAQTNDYKSAVTRDSSIGRQNEDWTHNPVAIIHGCSIYLNDSLTAADGVATCLLCAPEALQYFVADEPKSVLHRHAGSSVCTLDSHFRTACTLPKTAPRKVVKLLAPYTA